MSDQAKKKHQHEAGSQLLKLTSPDGRTGKFNPLGHSAVILRRVHKRITDLEEGGGAQKNEPLDK